MQATKKCTRSTPSPRSTPSGPVPLEGTGRRRPASAFADPFLEKLRLVVRVLEGEGAESPTEAEAVLAGPPAVPKLNPYHLSDRPTGLGWPLHVNRHHVGHVSRLSRDDQAKEGKGAKKACPRQQVLLSHLHLARYLAANPEALAQVIESAGPEALAALGRALARRVEAAVDSPSG